MAAPKKPGVVFDVGALADIRNLEKEKANSRDAKIKTFQGDDGQTLMLNTLMKKVALSYKPKRKAGRGEGEVDNEEFGKNEPGRGWTATDLYNDLPDEWRSALTIDDVELRLTGMWEDEGGEEKDKEFINSQEAIIHKNKVARHYVYRVNVEALLKQNEEADEKEPLI